MVLLHYSNIKETIMAEEEMLKKHHWRWGDIRYIDPATSYECSGGFDGKPAHAPMNMVMGTADVVLVCPICQTMFGNLERMESTSVQSRSREAERNKKENAKKVKQDQVTQESEQGTFKTISAPGVEQEESFTDKISNIFDAFKRKK